MTNIYKGYGKTHTEAIRNLVYNLNFNNNSASSLKIMDNYYVIKYNYLFINRNSTIFKKSKYLEISFEINNKIISAKVII